MPSHHITALLLLTTLPVPVNINLSSRNDTINCPFNASSISAFAKYVSDVSLRFQRAAERLFSVSDIVANLDYQKNRFLSKLIELHLLLSSNLQQRFSTKRTVSGDQVVNQPDAKVSLDSVHEHGTKATDNASESVATSGHSFAEKPLDLSGLGEDIEDLLANWPIDEIRMEGVGRWKEARLAHYVAEQFLKANRCPGCDSHPSGCGSLSCARTDGSKSSRLDPQMKDASANSPFSVDSSLNGVEKPLSGGDRNTCPPKDRPSANGAADPNLPSNHYDRRGQGNNPINQGQMSVRQRNNFASVNCGAKVVAFNREAQNAKEILSENKDAYMLNPCRAKIWFSKEFDAAQVSGDPELSDNNGIRLKWHDLGTYEIPQTSRTIHRFNVSIKNRRFAAPQPRVRPVEVRTIKEEGNKQGSLHAAGHENPNLVNPAVNLNVESSRTASHSDASINDNQREESIGDVSREQEAANHEQLYVKYIRFEMIEYEGNEHYCPLSLIRVYGSTLEDVITSQEQDEDRFIEVLQSSLSRTSSQSSSGAFHRPQGHSKRDFQDRAENPRLSTLYSPAPLDIQLFSEYASSRSLVSCSQYHKLSAGKTSVERKSLRIDDYCCLNLMRNKLALLLLTTLASSLNPLGQADVNVSVHIETNQQGNPAHLSDPVGFTARSFPSESASKDIEMRTASKTIQDLNDTSVDGKVPLSPQCSVPLGHASHLVTKASSSQTSQPKTDMNNQENDVTGALPEVSGCGDQPTAGSHCHQYASTIPKSSAKLSGSTNAPNQPLLVRFGNRISLLELNVSLHAAYLEELTDYYNEKIQFVYNATRRTIEQFVKQRDRQRQLIIETHRQSLTIKKLEHLVDYLSAESSTSLFKSLDPLSRRTTLFLLAVAMMATTIAASISILIFLTYHRYTCFLVHGDAPIKEPYRKHSPGYHRLSRAPWSRPLTSSVTYARRRAAIKSIRYCSALPSGSTSTMSYHIGQRLSAKSSNERELTNVDGDDKSIKVTTVQDTALHAVRAAHNQKCYKSTLKWELRRLGGSNQSDGYCAPRRRLSSIVFDCSTNSLPLDDSIPMAAYS